MKKYFRISFTHFLEWSFSPITHWPSISLKYFLQSCEKDFIGSFHIRPTSFTVLLFTCQNFLFFMFYMVWEWLPLFEGHVFLIFPFILLCKLLFCPLTFPLNFYYGVSQKYSLTLNLTHSASCRFSCAAPIFLLSSFSELTMSAVITWDSKKL